MPYVSRNGSNAINGLYANLQPGYAEEFLPDNNAEVLAYLAAVADGGSAQTADSRAEAKAVVDLSRSALGKALRAEVAVIVDEINALRQWLTQFKAAVAAAGSLAALKTNVAALPSMPDRTLVQARVAILAKIDTGMVD